ncbi:MAG: ABC transporter ATP-binding protein [Emcibacteraceae bacterium]|nr:ABC transporter ATP-binding protein [Emcibacteraceae bacterium]MDG1996768.1 ABC transporter ATP-binding protein [Emcibacteraceae bacterium]
MDGEIVIDVKGLTKIYGDKKVVDDFDLKVPRGAVYGFLGPNGSGKTTTIRMVCGLLLPNAGEGTCLGWDVITQSEEIKKKVGYMTQKFSLWEDLTIRENLEFVARMYEMDDQKRRVDDALDELGLRGREKQLAGSLSGGWKQRLALSACLMHDPDLLLLDEPTAGVDPKARREFWDTIHEVADRGVTILVSTHYMDEAVQCDYIAYIAYGKKLIDAPSGELVDQVGLHTWRVEGKGLAALTKNLEAVEGIEHIARFGTALHISGLDKDALKNAVSPYFDEPNLSWEKRKPGLEEVFIHLMSGSEDNFK